MSKALVIQSGGPTAVINHSLAGVIDALGSYSQVSHILGAKHGLHGLLHEQLYDLSLLPSHVWRDIAVSPGAALGSARIKPHAHDLDRIFAVFQAHDIRYLFYIGGNDSAEAALLIQKSAELRGYEMAIMHVPKTVDNDLMQTDHCPGFGSAARALSHIIAGDDLDNRSFYNGIKVNVTMGRHAGWLAAATALATLTQADHDPADLGPHLIYVPEMRFSQVQFLNDVQRTYDRLGRASVVVAEGIADQLEAQHHGLTGDRDEFGNAQLSGSGKLADYLVKIIKKNININTTLGSLRARADTLGYVQRSLPGLQSSLDQEESFTLGQAAVHAFFRGGLNHKMMTIKRLNNEPYDYEISCCDLGEVAQKTRLLPDEFLNSQGNGVTSAFLEYAKPLAGCLAPVRHLEAPMRPQYLGAFVRSNS